MEDKKVRIRLHDFVLTVPHAKPPDELHSASAYSATGGHPYDFFATTAGRVLATALKDSGAGSVTLMYADINRVELDMNRPWSRDSKWRSAVRETIEKQERPFVIDVHSYPVDYTGFEGMKVAILTPMRPLKWHVRVARDLWDNAHVSCGISISPGMSDVVQEYQSRGKTPTLMLEFSEAITEEQMEKEIAPALAHTLCQISLETSKSPAVVMSPCKVVDKRIKCYFVDARTPQRRIPLWFPLEVTEQGNDHQLFQCAHCKDMRQQEDLVVCAACKTVAYCKDKDCLVADWNAVHQTICCILSMPTTETYVGAGVKLLDTRFLPSGGCCYACGHDWSFKCSVCLKKFCKECDGWTQHFAHCYEDNIGI